MELSCFTSDFFSYVFYSRGQWVKVVSAWFWRRCGVFHDCSAWTQINVKVQLINVNSKMRKIENNYLSKKGRTYPLVKISFFQKILIRWICSILCGYVAFSSIVFFDMLLRSNDFKRLIVPEYCKYHVAYFVRNSPHCHEFGF